MINKEIGIQLWLHLISCQNDFVTLWHAWTIASFNHRTTKLFVVVCIRFCILFCLENTEKPISELLLASLSKLVRSHSNKMSLICICMKSHFRMKGWTTRLPFRKRPKADWAGLLYHVAKCTDETLDNSSWRRCWKWDWQYFYHVCAWHLISIWKVGQQDSPSKRGWR